MERRRQQRLTKSLIQLLLCMGYKVGGNCMSTAEELANVIEKMIADQVSEQMKVLEETYFAKSKQTLFSKMELAEKWNCSISTVSRILENLNVKPIGKRGKVFEYSIEDAEEAKRNHDKVALKDHELSVRARSM